MASKLRSVLSGPAVTHAARTTVAAMVSLLVARLFGLPEIYWAVISTLIVMQSSLGASLPIAWRRLVGTALGAAAGVALGTYFQLNIWVYGAGLFALGLLCTVLGRLHKQVEEMLDRSAYRYAGITLAITILIPRSTPIWNVAVHRFFEVSIGIAVALVMAVIWPERRSS